MKTKYVFLCCEKNALQIHVINTNNNRIKNVEKFKCSVTTKKKNQNFFHGEIDVRLNF